jgi:hypothetical protein
MSNCIFPSGHFYGPVFYFFHNTTFYQNPLTVLEHKDRISVHNALVICKEGLRTEGYIVSVVTHMLAAPVVRGDVMWYATLAAPAECPIKVMLRGSPPNGSRFSRTHSSAKYWSSKPRFPLASEFSRQKNPRNRIQITKARLLHVQRVS